jgi:myo-inositol-1(or 4)-monophosphatase
LEDELKWLLKLAKDWALKSKRFYNNRSNLNIVEKEFAGLTTSADIELEKFIMQEIEGQFTGHSVLSEEKCFFNKETIDDYKDKEHLWVLDPLDGTTNFLNGIDYFSLSLCYMKNQIPELGVVYRPLSGEIFYAQRGKGLYYKDERSLGFEQKIIPKENTKSLNQAVIAVSPGKQRVEVNAQQEALQLELIKESSCLRRMGSAALDMSYTCIGKLDGYAESGLKPWDIAAGILFASESGTDVLTIAERTKASIFDQNILVAKPPFTNTFKPSF